MFGTAWTALLSTILVASTLGPSGALGSLQPSPVSLDKRSAATDVDACWTNFASDPQNCPVVAVAYFKDDKCSEPYTLTRITPQDMIRDNNKELLFDGAIAHSLKSPFGSVRVVAAAPGIGLGFAKHEESDVVVQNVAWMSSDAVHKALTKKECVTFPNLDVYKVKIWTVRADDQFNRDNYAWNPANIPLKEAAAQCERKNKRDLAKKPSGSHDSVPFCLKTASLGGGGVLELYTTDDCTPDPKNPHSVTTQLYSTIQCTLLKTTEFKSFKFTQPRGGSVNPIFSPAFYSLGQKDGYHRCAQKDVSEVPFRAGKCHKMNNQNMFVGVYANDPQWPQPPPAPEDKIIRQSSGGLLLAPVPAHHPKPVIGLAPAHP